LCDESKQGGFSLGLIGEFFGGGNAFVGFPAAKARKVWRIRLSRSNLFVMPPSGSDAKALVTFLDATFFAGEVG